MAKHRIYLICNAHLDPVWLWQWPEGAAEAISTFRTAAEFCEKNKTFVFNHNEVTLYEWVRQYEPSLFKRIQKLVKAKRWHIMGGWYLQPDCNMPSGESFVRQISLGKAYFKKHFNVEPKTAINFDPFGHTRGLAQILAKSGYHSYLFGRPERQFLDLPADDFLWKGFDGSKVMATRFAGWYNTELGKARKTIEKRIDENKNRQPLAILWGVGNHGGGPSKIDLKQVNQLIAQTKDKDIIHSTPEKYFAHLAKKWDTLPEHANDINPWAVGCYTSQIRIKQLHRKLENEIFATEKMLSAAVANKLIKYPKDQLHQALCDLMNTQFHDILPGSSVEPAENDALVQASRGLQIVSELKARAFFALASGQKKPKQGQIPIMVYNPHPHKTKQTVQCEFNLFDVNNSGGFHQIHLYQKDSQLPSQVEKELCNLPGEWRKRVIFSAELAPGMNRFDCKLTKIDKKPAIKLKPKNGKITFKTKDLNIVINTSTGLIDKFAANGIQYLKPKSFAPIVINDNADCWAMNTNSFRDTAGVFKLMSKAKGTKFSGIHTAPVDSVRIIEDGPVRTVIETLLQYKDSFICQRYKLPKKGTAIDIEIRAYWNEKDKMLKLSIPLHGKNYNYIGQTAYGVQNLFTDGTESVSQKWCAAISKKDNKIFTCINDGIYGSDFKDNEIRLTLLRSAAYSAPSDENNIVHMVKDRFEPRMDQGHRIFNFTFDAGKPAQKLKDIDRQALLKNEKPYVLSFFPNGDGQKPKPLAILSDNSAQITATKQAENNKDFIFRIFEPTGKSRTTTLTLPIFKARKKLQLGAFEIKTLRFSPKTRKFTETDLLERPLK